MRTARTVTIRGGVTGGCLLPGGVCSQGGYIPAYTEEDPLSPPVDRHTPVKILPWPNFVAAGNYILSTANFLIF